MGVTPEQLAEWRRLVEAATEGPWELNAAGRAVMAPEGTFKASQRRIVAAERCHDEKWNDDSLFIAAARTAVPALLDEVERLAKRIELAGGYHARTKREVEIQEMLDAFPEAERDPADHIIAELLLLVDCGRNRVHELENEKDRLGAEFTANLKAMATDYATACGRIKELERLLYECATRLHGCAVTGGNAKYAVEGMVKTYLDPIGAKLPPWPDYAPVYGVGFGDEEDESDES